MEIKRIKMKPSYVYVILAFKQYSFKEYLIGDFSQSNYVTKIQLNAGIK